MHYFHILQLIFLHTAKWTGFSAFSMIFILLDLKVWKILFLNILKNQGDWLVCGGGPMSSLWNLTTRIMSGAIPPDTGTIFATKILDEKIYTSGQNTDLCVVSFIFWICITLKNQTKIYLYIYNPPLLIIIPPIIFIILSHIFI